MKLNLKTNMKTGNKLTVSFASALLILSLAGCSNLSTRDKNTIIGAGIGAAAGAVLTQRLAVLLATKSVNIKSKKRSFLLWV
jgi:osmotically inducible lipoprotein OsmB